MIIANCLWYFGIFKMASKMILENCLWYVGIFKMASKMSIENLSVVFWYI